MKESPEVYGTVTVGARGQVIIPAKARKTLKIRPGDQLIVMSGPPGRREILSFIPVERVSQVLHHFEERLTALKKELSKRGK